jgi:hypothetical protein
VTVVWVLIMVLIWPDRHMETRTAEMPSHETCMTVGLGIMKDPPRSTRVVVFACGFKKPGEPA